MYKFKFISALKYSFFKTLFTSFLVLIISAFNSEGNAQMIGFTIIVGIISLILIYLIILGLRKIDLKPASYISILLIMALIINEVAGIIIDRETNIFDVIINGKPWQISYKISDISSVLLSAYLCFILPIRKIEKSK